MNVNKYFDKIYIITMKKNKERHKYIRKLFLKYKIINYEFIYGIEGEKINTRVMLEKKYIDKKMINLPNPIGTILTHKDAWQKMIDNNLNNCVFFEDDVFFLKEFNINFNNFMESVPNDWSVLQFGQLPANFRYNNVNQKDEKINKYVIKQWSSISGAHFYGLNKRTAKILIDNLYPIYKAVDGYIGDMTNPWSKKKGIILQSYAPVKCFAVDCSHDNGQGVKFESHGI
jgi:GR25 family glycosyltransferase involved in LPS biosynthesis